MSWRTDAFLLESILLVACVPVKEWGGTTTRQSQRSAIMRLHSTTLRRATSVGRTFSSRTAALPELGCPCGLAFSCYRAAGPVEPFDLPLGALQVPLSDDTKSGQSGPREEAPRCVGWGSEPGWDRKTGTLSPTEQAQRGPGRGGAPLGCSIPAAGTLLQSQGADGSLYPVLS